MRSALKPLAWWYRKKCLSQRLHHLNFRFDIGTLFAKENSIVGNTCAQIFTNGEYFQIIPVRYRLEAGTTVDRINRDVRIANKIFMDNKPKQIGYNT